MMVPNEETATKSNTAAESEVVEDVEAYFTKLLDDISHQMAYILSKYRTPKEFDPVSSDVFIISWMKSGTTLTQNIIYQIMVAAKRVPTDPTGLHYRDISMVVPFIEMSPLCGVYYPVHTYHPIAWKSHSDISCFPAERYRNCRLIYLVRDGRQAARSFLDFFTGWALSFDCIDDLKEQFYHRFFLAYFLGCRREEDGEELGQWKLPEKPGWWFSHVKGFVDCDFPNILFVLYEDLVADLDKSVQMIADYLGVSVDDPAVQSVVSACDRKKMANDTRFNDSMVSEGMGFDTKGGRRVRDASEIGFSKFILTDECNRLYDEMFSRVFGMENYEALANHLRDRNASMRKRQGW